MSTAANSMVERIKSERLKQETKPPPPDPFVKLLIDRGLRRGLWLALLISLAVVMFFVARAIFAATDWRQLILPVVTVGVPLALFPKTEKWVYEPWQSHPRRYERTIKG